MVNSSTIEKLEEINVVGAYSLHVCFLSNKLVLYILFVSGANKCLEI